MIDFDRPFILFGFIIFILLFIADAAGRKKRITLTGELEKKIRASVFFFRLFLAFAIIALAGPKWGLGYAPAEYRRGLDIIFAIDVSRSMDIRDVSASEESRLERGLSITRDIIASIPGARFAAAIGRGRGYLAVPLTYDNEAILVFLESLDSFSMTGRGTNLEALVEAACNAFLGTSPAQKIIILISDGESHTGVFRNAINHCAREGIIINTVAAGSDEGQLILPRADDPHSAPVISRRDSAVMRWAAERTGGIYIDANRDDAASLLSNHLLSIAHQIEPGSGKKVPKQRHMFFIILALISYGVSKFVTRQPKRKLLTAALVITSILQLSSCSEGKLLLMEANYFHSRNRFDEALGAFLKALNHEDAAPYAEYGLGLTLYLLDDTESALNRYSNSQKLIANIPGNEHRELRYRNLYNSGIIFFEKEDFHSAAAFFREALRADPRRIDAKRNLELSLLSIKMEPKTENRTDKQQEQREILFEYLRQEEQQFWRSHEWAPEEDYTGLDY